MNGSEDLHKVGSLEKIVIAGAGSIGTVLGLLFRKQGHPVTLIRRRGDVGKLEIEIVGEETFKQPINVISSNTKFRANQKINCNVLIITSQRQQLENQLRDLGNIIEFKDKPIIIALQNGLGTAEVVCNWMRGVNISLPFIQGLVWWSATLQNDRLVLYHGKAVTALGISEITECQTSEQYLDKIINLFGSILDVKTVDIDKEPYTKLILNVVSPVLALVKQPYPTGVNDMYTRKIILILFEEAIEIAKDEGWYDNDNRIENFYSILKSDVLIDHYSLHSDLPAHKVSSQISAEKYGGKGSNVHELLKYFVSRNAEYCKKVYDLFLNLKNTYQPYTGRELYELLTNKPQ